MTVREINRALIQNKTVIAIYRQDGTQKHGRIIRARTQHGALQGKLLCSGHWTPVTDVWEEGRG
jgi:hypothetical protein